MRHFQWSQLDFLLNPCKGMLGKDVNRHVFIETHGICGGDHWVIDLSGVGLTASWVEASRCRCHPGSSKSCSARLCQPGKTTFSVWSDLNHLNQWPLKTVNQRWKKEVLTAEPESSSLKRSGRIFDGCYYFPGSWIKKVERSARLCGTDAAEAALTSARQ